MELFFVAYALFFVGGAIWSFILKQIDNATYASYRRKQERTRAAQKKAREIPDAIKKLHHARGMQEKVKCLTNGDRYVRVYEQREREIIAFLKSRGQRIPD